MQLFSRNKAIVALSLGALALGACGDDVTVPVAPAAPITLSITPPSANMNIGEAVNFAVQISGGPSTGAPTLASCTSSSATVATATVSGSSCRVTAIGAGNATITAAASTGQSAAASVSVAAPAAAISGLVVSPSAASVPVNQTVSIVPTVNRGASAVTVAYTYASSTASVATVTAAGVVTAVAPGVATITVTATGTGTGFTTTTLTSAAAITVTALPTGLTSLNVTPTTLSLSAGATAQLVASAQQPAGAAAAAITYGTTAPAIANVSATGLVTAVAPGTAVITVSATSAANANFAAATLSGSVAVTVSPSAQLSIASITSGLNFQAVDINSVNGQITVTTNLTTNGNNVSGVQLFACAAGTTCPAVGQTPVAQQLFGSSGAASGAISFLVNTAAFTVASDFSSASTLFRNGQTTLVATATSATGSSSANSNLAVLNLTNVDGYAASHTAPTNTARDANGDAWYGGPVAAGRGSVTVVPVLYTAGRTISTAVVTMNGCRAANADTVRFTTGTDVAPWTATYGTSATAPTGTKTITCSRSNTATTPTVTSIDNNNVSLNVSAGNFLTSTNTTVAVNAPASIRTDYQAPQSGSALAINSQNGSNNSWVNAAFNFDTAGVITTPVDSGVGIPTARVIEYAGCPVNTDSTTNTWSVARTGNDVPECGSSQANNVYLLRYRATDRLGNAVSATSGVVFSGRFGVDKTAPQVRYSAGSRGNATVLNTTAGDSTLFQIEALDERSGLNSTLASAADHYLVRANRMSTTNRAGACAVGSYPTVGGVTATNAGGAFITAPNCLMAAMAGSYGSVTADGYSTLQNITASVAGNEGYYTYRARVRDEAGNVTTSDIRSVLLAKSAPFTTTADALITSLTASYAGTFTGFFRDSVETQGYGLRLRYTNGGSNTVSLGFPMIATTATSFNNVITRDSLTALSTPFTSGVRLYTNIEYTNNDGTLSATPTVDSLGAHGLYAQNFGGLSNTGFSTFLTGITTFDATRWGNGAAGSVKNANLLSFNFDTTTVSGYNSPAGGLKARAFGNVDLTNSPFARVDFYHRVGVTSTWEYAGSVDGTATPCTNPSQSCGVYVAENNSQRAYTYVLRSVGSGAESFSSLSVGGLGSGEWVAVGVHSTGGRVLLTGGAFDVIPPA